MRSSQIHTSFRLSLPQYLARLWVRHLGTWMRDSWELRGASSLGPFLSLILAQTESASALTTFLAFGFMDMVP